LVLNSRYGIQNIDGPADSFPDDFVNLNGTLIFTAGDKEHGREFFGVACREERNQ